LILIFLGIFIDDEIFNSEKYIFPNLVELDLSYNTVDNEQDLVA